VQKRTDDVAAYDAYLKGIALLPRRDVAEMREALGHFERAIRIDPTYARAYVGAHDAVHLIDLYGNGTPAERARARGYLQRALALAPNLGEAHVARGVELENAGDLPGAEAAYRRGIALAPGYATGYQWLAELLAAGFGRFDEALPLFAKARELDPLSPVIRGTQIFALGQSGRVDEALTLANQLVADAPSTARSYDERSLLHQLKGDLVSALRDLRRQDELDPKAYGFRSHRCHTLMDFGALEAAETCLRPLAAQARDSKWVLGGQARLAALQGDFASARALLSNASRMQLEGFRASFLLRDRHEAEALAIYRKVLPGPFATPPQAAYPSQAVDLLEAGIAMTRTGQAARGRAMVEEAIALVADRPYGAEIAGRNWLAVIGHAGLGDRDAAFAALRQGIDAGYIQELTDLDADPLLADLRTDPRYEALMAPARAKAAAQVEAARAAGVL
jgi:tetratricopeptide (TPR) repeat protein